jgi:hypothetical protein
VTVKKNDPQAGTKAPAADATAGSPTREADLRKQRLAAALRENLKRRKAQARTRRDVDEA